MVTDYGVVDFSREESFEAAHYFGFGLSFGGAPGDVVDCGLVETHSDYDDPVQGRVGVAVTAAVESVAGGFPEDAGMGQAPQSLA
jgi:hypothetical protein